MQRRKEEIVLSTVIIAVITFCYFAFDNSKMGYFNGSKFYTHFTYMFAHSSILHLIVNSYVVYVSMNKNILPLKELIAVSTTIAILASFITASVAPTVGISGILFVIIGFSYALRPTRLNTLYMILWFCIAAISPMNTMLHLVCFLTGLSYMIIRKKWQRKKT